MTASLDTTAFARTVTEDAPKKVATPKHGKSGAIIATYANGMRAVIKVKKHKAPNGKTTQRDLPVDTLHLREMAFYSLAKMLGWHDLVPETVIIRYIGEEASAQIFLPAFPLVDLEPALKTETRTDWQILLIRTALKAPKSEWLRLLIMDLIAGSRDRHANNVGLVMRTQGGRATYSVRGWDNACTFGRSGFHKYWSVFHKHLFRYTVNLEPYWDQLTVLTLDDFAAAIGVWLSPREVETAFLRLQWMLEYPYRLPWRVMAHGCETADGFPSYRRWFASLTNPNGAGSLYLATG